MMDQARYRLTPTDGVRGCRHSFESSDKNAKNQSQHMLHDTGKLPFLLFLLDRFGSLAAISLHSDDEPGCQPKEPISIPAYKRTHTTSLDARSAPHQRPTSTQHQNDESQRNGWLSVLARPLISPGRLTLHRRERYGDGGRCRGSGVHRLEVLSQPRGGVEQVLFVGPVQRIGGIEVGDAEPVADEVLVLLHVPLQHRQHLPALLPGQVDVLRYAHLVRVEEGVAGNAPQRWLDLGHQEEDPTVHLGAFFHSAGDETRLWIFLGQVELYRGRFGDYLVAIDQHRNLGGGVEP